MPPRDGSIFAVNGTDYLVHGTRLFKTSDGGATWVASDFGLPQLVYSLVPDPQDGRVLYTLGLASATPEGGDHGSDGLSGRAR